MTEASYRRLLQFRLRSLLALILVLAIPLTWVSLRRQQGARQRHAVEAILNIGGTVEYAGTPVTPDRLGVQQFFADVFFKPVRCVNLRGDRVRDAELVHLQALTRLQLLDLGRTEVTDAGLVHLQGLTQLQQLNLPGTQVTDAGEAKLQRALPKCEIVR